MFLFDYYQETQLISYYLRNAYTNIFLIDRGINQKRAENCINVAKDFLFFYRLIPRSTEKKILVIY